MKSLTSHTASPAVLLSSSPQNKAGGSSSSFFFLPIPHILIPQRWQWKLLVELLNHTFTLSFIPHSPLLIRELPATFSDINLFMAYWLMVLGWDPLSKKKESWALQPAAASHQFPHPSTCSHQPPWMCSPPDTKGIKQQSLNGRVAFAIRLWDRFHLLVLCDVPRAVTGWPIASCLTVILPCIQLPFGKKHQVKPSEKL